MRYRNTETLVRSSLEIVVNPSREMELVDAITDYLFEMGVDMDYNFDDFMVNSLTKVDEKEWNEYGDDYFLIYSDGKTFWILQ